jgi:hypothetical protein
VFPLLKTCQICLRTFKVTTREQFARNKTCSPQCKGKALSLGKTGKTIPMEKRKGRVIQCAVCGVEVWKPNARLRTVQTPTCSCECNGKLRAKELVRHSHKGRSGWTGDSMKSYLAKMTGEGNPAWKGGVTYFRKHGNYKSIKYVRCPPEFMAMARRDGYVMEHRLIVARALGRALLRTEVVHHENHDPQDNRLENLELFASNKEHKLHEARGLPLPIWRGLKPCPIAVSSGA